MAWVQVQSQALRTTIFWREILLTANATNRCRSRSGTAAELLIPGAPAQLVHLFAAATRREHARYHRARYK